MFECRSRSSTHSDAEPVACPTSSVARACNRNSCPFPYPLRVLCAHGPLEITRAVSLDEPLFLGAPGFVHAAASLHSRACFNVLPPTAHMRGRAAIKNLGGFIDIVCD